MKLGLGQLLVEGGEPDRNLDRAKDASSTSTSGSNDCISCTCGLLSNGCLLIY